MSYLFKDKANKGYSYHLEDGVLKLSVLASIDEPIVIDYSDIDVHTFNLFVSSNCSVNIIEVYRQKSMEKTTTFLCDCHGSVKHQILYLGEIKTINFNHLISNDGGSYSLAIIDINKGTTLGSTNIDLLKRETSSELMLATLGVSGSKVYKNRINNKASYTAGYMEHYGVASDNSVVNIEGIGCIEKGAKQASNRQKSTLVLTDKTAKATSKPYLFINEDDVTASHSTSVGEISSEDIFYLCSRGLDKELAKKMIILGYFQPVIDKIGDDDLKEEVINSIKGVIFDV